MLVVSIRSLTLNITGSINKNLYSTYISLLPPHFSPPTYSHSGFLQSNFM